MAPLCIFITLVVPRRSHAARMCTLKADIWVVATHPRIMWNEALGFLEVKSQRIERLEAFGGAGLSQGQQGHSLCLDIIATAFEMQR